MCELAFKKLGVPGTPLALGPMDARPMCISIKKIIILETSHTSPGQPGGQDFIRGAGPPPRPHAANCTGCLPDLTH